MSDPSVNKQIASLEMKLYEMTLELNELRKQGDQSQRSKL